MMSSNKQVVPEPIVVDDSEEAYDTFVDQDDKMNSNAQLGMSLSIIYRREY